MTPEKLVEAFARGLMQGMMQQTDVAPTPRAKPRRESQRGTAARATPPSAVPELVPPLQTSMFEQPGSGVPTAEDLDKILGITRPAAEIPPADTYIPEDGDKLWMAR